MLHAVVISKIIVYLTNTYTLRAVNISDMVIRTDMTVLLEYANKTVLYYFLANALQYKC